MSIRITLTMSIVLALALFTASCQTFGHKAAKPSFAVSSAFEGKYYGERFDISGDQICNATKISGTVSNGFARLRLHYNDTILTGWIAQDGSLRLDSDSFKWEYNFTGKAERNKIKGRWFVENAPCRGTWYVQRK